jgi:glutaredoxin
MNVIIYSKPDCSECTKAKMLLSSRGINYRELKLNEDFTRETLIDMFPSARSFPIIVVDGFNVGNVSELQKMIELVEHDKSKEGRLLLG